jgi:hypothetical protein
MIKCSKIPEIFCFREQGYSLHEISEILSIPYSTVRKYCKNIVMSNDGKKRFASKIIGVKKHISIVEGLTIEKVRIIANLLFDGSVFRSKYHYGIMYVNSSKDLIFVMIEDIRKSYSIEPHIEKIQGKVGKYSKIRYFSKGIYLDLLKYMPEFSTSSKACKLPPWLMNGPKEIKLLFLQAFWENEGSIAKSGTLAADLKSRKVMKQLSVLHLEFGLKHYICEYDKGGSVFKLILNRGKENYLKFYDYKLFERSTVTKGYFIRKKKKEVLRQYLLSRTWIQGNL